MNALLKAVLLLCVGALLGVPLGMQWQKSVAAHATFILEYDDNGDGRIDNIFSYREGVLESAKLDSNFDGRFDYFDHFTNGLITRSEFDTNFDDQIDRKGTYRHGRTFLWESNLDANPASDAFEYYEAGQLKLIVFRPNDGTRVTRLDYFNRGYKTQELRDKDGDGLFEHARSFDEFEELIKEEIVKQPLSAPEAVELITKFR